MQCPNCGNDVPARPICLRCGYSLFGSAAMPASALGLVPVPLTTRQKVRLLAGCLPLVTFALMVAGYLALVGREIVPPPAPFLFLVLVLVILVLGYQAVQRLRDLVSGAAVAQEDLLNRSWAGRSAPGRGTYYGTFEQLGTLRLIPKVHFQNSPGQRYRAVYSPASKIVWALEPPDPRIR
jgi:xanthosine utilization system XapX-like protein